MTELIPYFIHIDNYNDINCPIYDRDDIACIRSSEHEVKQAGYRCQGCIICED